MGELITQKVVKTRKSHKCWGCAKEFPIGSTLLTLVEKDNGLINKSYWCSSCRIIINSDPESYVDGVDFGDLAIEEAK
jgi:hypothetical protein